MATPGIQSVAKYQQARNTIEQEIDEIITCLQNKKIEMFKEISNLEDEFTLKQEEEEREIRKLDALITQTEELGENNLLKIQHKVVEEIQKEIEILNLESKQKPNYDIKVIWGFSSDEIFRQINNSMIEKVEQTTFSEQTPSFTLDDVARYDVSDFSDDDLNVEGGVISGKNSSPVTETNEDLPPVLEELFQRRRQNARIVMDNVLCRGGKDQLAIRLLMENFIQVEEENQRKSLGFVDKPENTNECQEDLGGGRSRKNKKNSRRRRKSRQWQDKNHID